VSFLIGEIVGESSRGSLLVSFGLFFDPHRHSRHAAAAICQRTACLADVEIQV
jgi:hypothetical protein